MGVVLAMYFVNTVVFNLIHLRLKKEMVAWWPVLTLTIYKLALSFVNSASVYWTLYEYATYFADKHFRIVDDPKALEVFPSLHMCLTKGCLAITAKAIDLHARWKRDRDRNSHPRTLRSCFRSRTSRGFGNRCSTVHSSEFCAVVTVSKYREARYYTSST